MPDRAFIDTNILVYAIETVGADADKPAVARSLLDELEACLSTQVLGEFYSATTNRKRESPLTHEEASAWIQLWKRFEVQSVTSSHVDLALEIAGIQHVNYYDALILATARLAGCKIVYSEDLNPDQDYGGVRVQNPFVRE